jgi:hypothetical protein
MTVRPSIPQRLKREILLEAGHRCAIPTCRQTPVEIAHIVSWATVKEHTFDNLIALCPTCHTRYDKKEIDRQSMCQYKANLSVLNGRYGDIEIRALRYFADNPDVESIWLIKGFDILIMYLIDDGLLDRVTGIPNMSGGHHYFITPKGREFIDKWLNAQNLE